MLISFVYLRVKNFHKQSFDRGLFSKIKTSVSGQIMSCCVPDCGNTFPEWTTGLPRDEELVARWKAAILAGTGQTLSDELIYNGTAQICNGHFAAVGLGQDQQPEVEYREPTVFFRNGIQLRVSWCRLCLRHDVEGAMFNAADCSSSVEHQQYSLLWMANKYYGVWLLDATGTIPKDRFFCSACKYRLELTHRFGQEIQAGTEQSKKLQQKMFQQKLSLWRIGSEAAYGNLTISSVTGASTPNKDTRTSKIPPDCTTDDQSTSSDDDEHSMLPPAKKRRCDCSENECGGGKNCWKRHKKKFAVVQLIDGRTTKVTAVPVSWLRAELLMWPKQMNGEAVRRLRAEGAPLEEGTVTEDIPVTVLGRFRNFPQAEEAAQAIYRSGKIGGGWKDGNRADKSDILTPKMLKLELSTLKNDLQALIQSSVATAVEQSFNLQFDRRYGLFGPMQQQQQQQLQKRQEQQQQQQQQQTIDQLLTPEQKTIAEKHKRIETETELDTWNTQLADELVVQKYREYFSKIIRPNTCLDKGDNAVYTIVDCLFTRDFWNRFTWTGINRGGLKSNRGFREFANVIQLLLDVVLVGDSNYSAHKLEEFCRNRLFRHSKQRAKGQQVRRSACRPSRKKHGVAQRDDAGGGTSASGTDLDAGNSTLFMEGMAPEAMVWKIEVDPSGDDEEWRPGNMH